MSISMRAELAAFCHLAAITEAELIRRLIAHYLRAEPLPPVRERDLAALLQERIDSINRDRR